MIGPVLRKLLEIEERHIVDYGVAVSAGGSEEAIDMFPALHVSSTERCWSAIVDVAPGPGPGADASPRRSSRSLKPDPVRTAFRTAPALPRSSRFSTISAVASG